MCLNTNQLYARKAEKDIVCYKLLILDTSPCYPHQYGLYSPYYGNMSWEIGLFHTDPHFEKKAKSIAISHYTVHYAFHTYKHLQDAKSLGERCHYRCFECIIPQDSLYYEGWVNGAHDIMGYGSEKLKIVREINLH